MDILSMSKEDFQTLSHIRDDFDYQRVEFDNLIIIPTNEIHSSGFMCMDFIACNGENPIGRLSGWSDVLHLGGISGRCERKASNDWKIDCLPCGYLRLWGKIKTKSGK